MPTKGSREQDDIVRKACEDSEKFTEREKHRGHGADNGTRNGGSIGMGSDDWREKNVTRRSTKKDGPYYMD